jgi:hypothetical protein
MNWLLKLLSRRDREYGGDGFRVRLDPVFREVVSVTHKRQGTTTKLGGESIGKKWEGISVQIPLEIEAVQAVQIARDLATAFEGMRYGYLITHKIGIDVVPESERHAAIVELREMGYEIEFLSHGKIRQTKRAGAPRHDIETLRKQAPHMMSLIQSLRGTRPRFEVLAKSKEF